MALAFGNEDEEKQAYYGNMEEEAPPPAFQMDSQPASTVHIPTNSIMSVEAEVFKEPQNKPASPNMAGFNNMMNMNNPMMMPNMNNMNNMKNMKNRPPNMNNMNNMNPMMMQNKRNMNMQNMQNMAPNMGMKNMGMKNMNNPMMMPNNNMGMKNMPNNMANNKQPKMGGPMGNNGGMPFPILSEDFMKNMMNMAANMDMSAMNNNMQFQLQQQQQQQRNASNNIKQIDNIRKVNSSPNVINKNNKNNNYNPYSQKQKQNNKPKIDNNMKYINDMVNNKPMKPMKQKSNPEREIVHIPSEVIVHQPIPSQIIKQKENKSEFDNPIQEELVSMGFEKEYVIRACNLYKKKFKNKPLRLEVLTEIIIRLQQRDQNRNRAKSIDSVAAPEKNNNQKNVNKNVNQNVNQNNNNNNNGNHQRRRSSFQGASVHKMQNLYNNAGLQQSMSYDYNLPNNVGNNNNNNNNEIHKNNSGESVAISIIMPSSSIGLQTCDIIIRKDQTLQDAKQLISTCLTDFDQFDESYAFFHDQSGFIFNQFDITVMQALQLMDIDVNNSNIVFALKIGRIVSKYIKLN